jgi:hypothetical protein
MDPVGVWGKLTKAGLDEGVDFGVGVGGRKATNGGTLRVVRVVPHVDKTKVGNGWNTHAG